jgi:glutamate--cysteine ligase catalytic subunit
VFPGLIPLIESYLFSGEVDVDTYQTLEEYLRLISERAAGTAMTDARWIRHFVRSHPAYK